MVVGEHMQVTAEEVKTEFLQCPDHHEAPYLGSAVMFLQGAQGAALIGDEVFFVILPLV